MTLDVKALFKRMKGCGFVKFRPSDNKHVGICYSRMQNCEIPVMIHYWNAVFRGIWNYYSFVDNVSTLNSVWWALQESLAYTISRKLRQSGIKGVFKRFGYPTKSKQSDGNKVAFWRPVTFARDTYRLKELAQKSRVNQMDVLNGQNLDLDGTWKWKGKSVIHSCLICRTIYKVEMHHVREIKALCKNTPLDLFTAEMAANTRKRKNVTLCRPHILALHQGKLSEVDQKLFREGCKLFVGALPAPFSKEKRA